MDRRRPNVWFLASWVLLVVVVALGFFIQARTIDSLHQTQDRIRLTVVRVQREEQAICALLEKNGIHCPPEGG